MKSSIKTCSICQHYSICSFRRGYDRLKLDHPGLFNHDKAIQIENKIAFACLQYMKNLELENDDEE